MGPHPPDDAARRVLDELAAELHALHPDEAWRRLGELPEQQRAWVIEQIDGWGAGPDAAR